MSIVQIPKTCACGHDRSSHYRDGKGEGDCLAIGFCDCAGFVDRHEGKPYPQKKRVDEQVRYRSTDW